MLHLTTTAREFIDFAADFVVALPGHAAALAPVILSSAFVGAIAGAWLASAWHSRCARREAAAWQELEQRQRRTIRP